MTLEHKWKSCGFICWHVFWAHVDWVENNQYEVECCLQAALFVFFQISCWTSKVSHQWWSLRRSELGLVVIGMFPKCPVSNQLQEPACEVSRWFQTDREDDCTKLLHSSSCGNRSIFPLTTWYPICFALSAIETDLFERLIKLLVCISLDV